LKSDSSTSLNRLVHLFGYDLSSLSKEQTVISMRFAIRISKGITLSLLLSYSVVKEPTSAKGRQSCQTPTAVSSGLLPGSPEPNPSDTDTPTARICYWERSAEKLLRPPLAGTGDCMSSPSLCQLPQVSSTTPCATSLFHSAKIASGPACRCHAFPFSPLHKLLCKFELSSVFQRSSTA
jgi:hypothetical protein